ncbi:Posterior sex combs [Carabus blaptoides fortunei]
MGRNSSKMDSSKPHNTKAKLTEVNSYITCYLCKGYYVDATTIVECLHSFCRSCIIKHLHANSYCPICEVMINTAKPNIKLDKTLQDIVYKLVPGLYTTEMGRRRTFWANHPNEAQKVTCPEARGQTTERIIFSPQDAISLSIEYTSDDKPDWNRNQAITGNGTEPEVPLRRYLQCPAMLRVEHLKKFICNKYSVNNKLYHVDILHKRVPLPDHYTLMDIAYIYAWKRNEPMKFFFRITDINLVSERFDYFEPSSMSAVPEITEQPTRCYRTPKHNNAEKKELALKKGQKVEKLQNVNKTCDIVKNNDNKKSCDMKSVDKNSVQKKPDTSVNKCKVSGDPKVSEIELCEIKKENDTVNNEQCESKVNTETNIKVEEDVGDNDIKNDSFKENDSDIANSKSTCDLNTVNSNTKSSDTKVPTASKDSSVRTPKAETSVSCSALSISNKNNDSSKIVAVKIEPETPEIDNEKSEFLKSIQLTARNTSPPVPKPSNPKPSIPELIRPKIPLGVKRNTPNSSSHTSSNKRNILEIAHQLSKRSRLELEVPTLKIPSSPSPNSIPKTSPALKSPKPKDSDSSTPKQIIINSNFSSGGSISIKNSPPKTMLSTPKMPIPRLPIAKAPTPKLNPPNIRNGGLLKYSNYAAKLAANSNSAKSPTGQPAKSPNSTKSESSQSTTVQGLSPNQILEKYNITNLAQYNANLNQAQFAFQQALMMSHQIEMQRMQQNQNQKHWMNNPNILAHYENYVQSLKKQQNQVCSNGNKN